MTESNADSHLPARVVSSEQREAAVKTLSAAFASDAIPVDEFERRVADVYKAASLSALRKITEDLPAPEGTTEIREDSVAPVPIVSATGVVRRDHQNVESFLSSVERNVQGPMPEQLNLRSVVGSLELDLRGADFPPGVTEIRVEAILGNIEIELPDYVSVEHEGRAILGAFSVRGRSRGRRREERPVVRITGRSILGNVEVEVDD